MTKPICSNDAMKTMILETYIPNEKELSKTKTGSEWESVRLLRVLLLWLKMRRTARTPEVLIQYKMYFSKINNTKI